MDSFTNLLKNFTFQQVLKIFSKDNIGMGSSAEKQLKKVITQYWVKWAEAHQRMKYHIKNVKILN